MLSNVKDEKKADVIFSLFCDLEKSDQAVLVALLTQEAAKGNKGENIMTTGL